MVGDINLLKRCPTLQLAPSACAFLVRLRKVYVMSRRRVAMLTSHEIGDRECGIHRLSHLLMFVSSDGQQPISCH